MSKYNQTLKELSPDKKSVIDNLNCTDVNYEFNDIMDYVNTIIRKYPDNTMVRYKEKSYTYAQSANIVNALSEKINALNNAKVFGILVERSEWSVFCPLSMLATNNIYIPVDLEFPNDALSYMFNDASADAIFVNNSTKQRAEEIAKKLNKEIYLVNVDEIDTNNLRLDTEIHLNSNNPQDTSSVLYTSGTTGQPKGVLLNRKAVNNVAQFNQKILNIKNGEFFAFQSSYNFDLHIISFFSNFIVGAGVDIIPEEIRKDVYALYDFFKNRDIQYTIVTTQIAKIFAKKIKSCNLKIMQAIGEKLGKIETDTDYIIMDTYGPTETTCYVTWINAKDKVDDCSIGHPNENSKIYILDKNLNVVPFGESGQIYISGHQMSNGYLNKPDLTKEFFVKNIYDGGTPGYELMYASGDFGHYLEDGSIGFDGRKDSQIKISGHRIELGEIENKIRDLNYIDDVTVQCSNINGNDRLLAYVVSNKINVSKNVAEYLKDNLAPYMQPYDIIQISSIPLNIHGKVDKKALEKSKKITDKVEYQAPETNMEKIVCAAFNNIFEADQIGVNDSFLNLGGDSLTAIQLRAQLKDYIIDVGQISKLDTPKKIAKYLSDQKKEDEKTYYNFEKGFPITYAQYDIYEDVIFNNKTKAYRMSVCLNLGNKYSTQFVLEKLEILLQKTPAISCIVEDHSLYGFAEGICKTGQKPEIKSIETTDTKQIKNAILWTIQEFDLKKTCARFYVIKYHDFVFLAACFHHVIFDGFSISSYKKRLFDLLEERNIDLDNHMLKAAEYNYSTTDRTMYEKSYNFYKDMLAIKKEFRFEEDKSNDVSAGITPLDVSFSLIDDYCQKQDLFHSTFFYAAFILTLSHMSKDKAVYFNAIDNGRSILAVDESVGMYSRVLPIAYKINDKQTITEFLNSVQNCYFDSRSAINNIKYAILYRDYQIDNNIIIKYMGEQYNEETMQDLYPINDKTDEILALEKYIQKCIAKNVYENDDSSVPSDFEFDILIKDSKIAIYTERSTRQSDKQVNQILSTFEKAIKALLTSKNLNECFENLDQNG